MLFPMTARQFLLHTSCRPSFKSFTPYHEFHVRRQCVTLASLASNKKRLVFLGTPDVAALVLRKLLEASQLSDATFEVTAVVSQPGRPKGRGKTKTPTPSPVEALARSHGYQDDRLLCPVWAREEGFLAALTDLQPDLCVTAAYGNILPQRFLDIPTHGTLNIHPSLLPLYRGAAPVQRALQDGVAETGVSVAYTVRAMDAGPVLRQQRVPVPPDVTAPELLEQLFTLGTDLLLEALPCVWSGTAVREAVPQDEAHVTHAAKLSKEESVLDFTHPATMLHNKVRAFAGWPGTYHPFLLLSGATPEPLELKILRTRVHAVADSQHQHVPGMPQLDSISNDSGAPVMELQRIAEQLEGQHDWSHAVGGQVSCTREVMCVPCGDGAMLELVEVQAPGKRAMLARDFLNGLRGKQLLWQRLDAQQSACQQTVTA